MSSNKPKRTPVFTLMFRYSVAQVEDAGEIAKLDPVYLKARSAAWDRYFDTNCRFRVRRKIRAQAMATERNTARAAMRRALESMVPDAEP